MREVTVRISNATPMLMHADNIDWADKMEAWKNDPNNKGASKAGDDRTPAWRWIGCLNYDNPQTGIVTIPSEYIMACIMGGATEVPTGKGKKTFKAQSQSGIMSSDFHWPLLVNGKTISMRDIQALLKVQKFSDQIRNVEDLGFSLLVKRAAVNGQKHIRVRPRFDNWSTAGKLLITDENITDEVLTMIVNIAGRLKGLGDWRPGSPKKPGPWGMFTATVEA